MANDRKLSLRWFFIKMHQKWTEDTTSRILRNKQGALLPQVLPHNSAVEEGCCGRKVDSRRVGCTQVYRVVDSPPSPRVSPTYQGDLVAWPFNDITRPLYCQKARTSCDISYLNYENLQGIFLPVPTTGFSFNRILLNKYRK